MFSIATIKYVNDSCGAISVMEDTPLARKSSAFLSELPPASDYKPEPPVAGLPPSTAIFANPVRYRHSVACDGTPVELRIRSFGIRGCILEEDIVAGSADALRVIFVGLFDRFASIMEARRFARVLSDAFLLGVKRTLRDVAVFVKAFPNAPANVAMQYMAAIRKASGAALAVNSSRAPADVLNDLIAVHLEHAAVGASASFMRGLLERRSDISVSTLVKQTRSFIDASPSNDVFHKIFDLLLRRRVTPAERRILQTFGAIQIHHGSAGSNMVARYFASLHTRSVSDLFTAAQMTLDCARHFGAITDLTDFVSELQHASPSRRDKVIRQRAMDGNLPAFGHPEIAAAGRGNSIELDPRPAIYLTPVFEALDSGHLQVPADRLRRAVTVQRMYQLAFVEGIEKPGRNGRLRIAPNTDFGAWILQELLGVDETDRTLLSYVFRGFGWMMDAREQLQQPVIRPVIAPDPRIVPGPASDQILSSLVEKVHNRLCLHDAFTPNDFRVSSSEFLCVDSTF
jgi:citrate synthase